MLRVLIAVLVVTTWYRVSDFDGPDARYCGTCPPVGPLVAIDAELMYDGVVGCGTKLALYYPDHGISQVVTVWDIGPLGYYYVDDDGFRDLPLMLDLDYESGAWPVALEGLLSARVWVSVVWELPEPIAGKKGRYK